VKKTVGLCVIVFGGEGVRSLNICVTVCLCATCVKVITCCFFGVRREWLCKLCLVVSSCNFSCIHWHSCQVTESLLGEEYGYYRKIFKCNKCTGCVYCCVKENRLWKLCEWVGGGLGWV
jgi:hypothetical protein